MSNRSADDVIDGVKHDQVKLALTIESMAAIDPSLENLLSLKQENLILFLKSAKQDIFDNFMTNYGCDCVDKLPQEKLNAWLEKFKLDILTSTTEQINMYEKLVRYEYMPARQVLFMIVNCDKNVREFGDAAYIDSVYALFETCLYSMGEFDDVSWGDFENLSVRPMKIVAQFFVNRERLMNAQRAMMNIDNEVPVEKRRNPITKTEFKYQSQSKKMLFVMNIMQRNRIAIICILALFAYTTFYQTLIAGRCTISSTQIYKTGDKYERKTRYTTDNFGIRYDFYAIPEIIDTCHIGKFGVLECNYLSQTSECHIGLEYNPNYDSGYDEDDGDTYTRDHDSARAHRREFGYDPWQRPAFNLGPSGFTRFVHGVSYVNYILIAYTFFNIAYWSYYENDLIYQD
jgi:hypothetical protein